MGSWARDLSFSFWIWRFPFAVNDTLILSNVEIFYTQEDGFSELCKLEYVFPLAVLKNLEDIISDYPTRNKRFFFSEPGRRRRDSNPGDIGERRWPPLLPKHMHNNDQQLRWLDSFSEDLT